MNLAFSQRLSRRTFLKGAGVCLALHYLEAMTPVFAKARPVKNPKRFVAVGNSFGMYPPAFFPSASGTRYTNIVEFREAMLRRTPQISRSLVSKLLELGTGRRMEIGDRPAIDDIVEELEGRGNGFYDLVELVASSETFGRP